VSICPSSGRAPFAMGGSMTLLLIENSWRRDESLGADPHGLDYTSLTD